MSDKRGIVVDTNNAFLKRVWGEAIEFVVLLIIGIIIVFFLTGDFELTPYVIIIDIVQNFLVFAWIKTNIRGKFKWLSAEISSMLIGGSKRK